MNFYGIYRGFYDIETGFYDIEVGVYEIDERVYEMAPSEEQMLLQRHRRLTADVEPVRGSSVPHSGVTVWWSARLIWVRSPCDPSRKLSTSDSK